MLPVKEICQEKWVPGRFASAIRSWGDDVARYKGLRAYKDVSAFSFYGLLFGYYFLFWIRNMSVKFGRG